MVGDRIAAVAGWWRVRASDQAEIAVAAGARAQGVAKLIHYSGPDDASIGDVLRTLGVETTAVYQEGRLRVSFPTR